MTILEKIALIAIVIYIFQVIQWSRFNRIWIEGQNRAYNFQKDHADQIMQAT